MESSSDGPPLLRGLLLLQAGGFSPSNYTILIIIILVLLLITAITAGSETAFFSLKAKDINYLKTKENNSARQAVHLLEQPKLLLATILVANNFINIAIVITINLLTSSIFQGIYPDLTAAEIVGQHALIYYGVQIVGVTFLLVLFGEVLPKVYATQNNLRMALFSAPVISVMHKIFRPVSQTLVRSTSFLEKSLSTKKPNANLSTEDFEHAIELTVGHTATREEVNIFKGILKFGNITARQIMHTRLDVAAVDFNMTFPQVQQYSLDHGYSRMPVYKGNLDTVAGIIYTKDFLEHLDDASFDWHQLIRPAYFVHEGKLIEDLLRDFQQKRSHMAIVVDEFGGTSGIVTLEDIMEEVIGEIRDEFDQEDVQYRKIDDYNYIFDGKILINDMCRLIGIPSDEFDEVRGESDSLAGLILEIGGKFPAVNEDVSSGRFDFTVLEVDKMRIKRVKVTMQEEEEEEA